ncbi:hypothetical protein D3C71_1314470 [compost metagenome]
MQVPQHRLIDATHCKNAPCRDIGKLRNRVSKTPEQLRTLPLHRALDFMGPGAFAVVGQARSIGGRPLRVAHVVGAAVRVGSHFISATFKREESLASVMLKTQFVRSTSHR